MDLAGIQCGRCTFNVPGSFSDTRSVDLNETAFGHSNRHCVYRKKNREHQNRTEASLELGHSTLKDNDLAFFEEWVKVDSSP